MTLIRPSIQEEILKTLFALDPDRPMYYSLVVTVGKRLFVSLGYDELVEELDKIIKEHIEEPLHAPFIAVIHAYYNYRFMFSKRAYTRVGNTIDYKEVSRFEIGLRLEEIKEYIYNRAIELAPLVRMTSGSQMTA